MTIGHFASASERQPLGACPERVARRHDDGMAPRIVGERHQLGAARQRLGGDADVGLAVERASARSPSGSTGAAPGARRGTPCGRRDRLGQRVARLRVRGGDRQRARSVSAYCSASRLMFSARAACARRCATSSVPGSVNPSRRLPRRTKISTPQLVLEVLDVLADARLRRVAARLLPRSG